MRLRIVIRRHNLPDAAVAWAIEPSDDPTISQLLEQVNEVIPLESDGDWGLEDYLVELKGSETSFECLHFQLARTILHEDDEISVRPLLSHDLRLRKLSGRHQITPDGRHLFDGSIFGRPRPRGPVERPAIEIPPRKRRRITYNDEGTNNSQDNGPLIAGEEAQTASDPDGNRQLILSADFEDDDEQDDDDFEPNEGEDEEDSEEGISEEDMNEYHHPIVDGLGDKSSNEHTHKEVQDEVLRPEVQKLREAFPKASILLCKQILLGCHDDLGKAWDVLSQVFKPSKPRKDYQKLVQDQETLHPVMTRSTIKRSSKRKKSSLLKESSSNLDANGGEPPPDHQNTSLPEHCGQHRIPAGSISSGEALSQVVGIVGSNSVEGSEGHIERTHGRRVSTSTARSNRSVRFADNDIANKTSDSLSLCDSNHSEDKESEAESSIRREDSSSDSGGESSGEDDDESTSSEETDTNNSGSTSNSGSDSDSEPDEVSSRPAHSLTSAENTGSRTGSEAQKEVTVPPGQGKKSTRARNQRRRIANQLRRFKNKGVLPAGTTIGEMTQLDLDRIHTPEDALEELAEVRAKNHQSSKGSTEKAVTTTSEFEAKRQQLLVLISSEGFEVGPQQPTGSSVAEPLGSASIEVEMLDKLPVPAAAGCDTPLTKGTNKSTKSAQVANAENGATSSVLAIATTSAEYPTQFHAVSTGFTLAESVSRPRRKIDLGAAGRMLFGALGVRAPKTKADHEKVRSDLIKDIRPIKTVPTAEVSTKEDKISNIDEDPGNWRDVINLRAVECCHDGVELSPAPFPFVQRWDPQQQGYYSREGSRGGKGKRSQRNQSQYYDEHHLSKKRKRDLNHDNIYTESNEQYLTADTAENEGNGQREEIEMEHNNVPRTQVVYSDGVEVAVNDQIMRDVQEIATSQTSDYDDLPRLPENISMLLNFTGEEVKPGMVIAFKQLILSEATNWQPQISSYRTAVVIKASENGELELRLAKRDREQTEKYYDAGTGERIYGKFDMPTDDEDDAEDDGFLAVTINELVEPKIVQLAPESLGALVSSPEATPNKTNASNDNSTRLGHANSDEISKVSLEERRDADESIGYQGFPIAGCHSPTIRGGELSADDAEDILALSVSRDTREEISELIKEAGFRTSVPSSVLRAQTQLPATPLSNSEKGPHSPRFNGFGSSPSTQSTPGSVHLNASTPNRGHMNRSFDYNESIQKLKTNLPSPCYPKFSVPSSLASQVSDRGRQPDYPIPGDDTLNEYDDADSLDDHEESLAIKTQGLPSTPSANVSNASPPDPLVSSPYPEFEPPSSGGLPTLEEVFSTARSSIGPKQETHSWLPRPTFREPSEKMEESYNRAMEELDAKLDEAEDAEQMPPKVSQNRSHRSSAPPASQKARASQFKIPLGSQQVDLTLSSDVEPGAAKPSDGNSSYDDDFSLPRGPGWVKKKTRRSRRLTTGNSQVSSQKGTQASKSRRKTVSKF